MVFRLVCPTKYVYIKKYIALKQKSSAGLIRAELFCFSANLFQAILQISYQLCHNLSHQRLRFIANFLNFFVSYLHNFTRYPQIGNN